MMEAEQNLKSEVEQFQVLVFAKHDDCDIV